MREPVTGLTAATFFLLRFFSPSSCLSDLFILSHIETIKELLQVLPVIHMQIGGVDLSQFRLATQHRILCLHFDIQPLRCKDTGLAMAEAD